MTKQRVQKIIAASGFCSRRKAEELIESGKVMVNGKKITIGDQADPDKDKIMVGKNEIKVEDHIYLMLHKPSGFITTRTDPFGQRNVMELVEGLPRPVYPVGRLDKDARGLLLMTSDGDFSQKVLHPSNETSKTYLAILNRPMEKDIKEKIAEGVKVDGRVVQAELRKIKPRMAQLTVHEGRNKIVKRFFRALEYYVDDLKRVGIGNIHLGNLKEGRWKRLTKEQVETLMNPPKRKIKKIIEKKKEEKKKFTKDRRFEEKPKYLKRTDGSIPRTKDKYSKDKSRDSKSNYENSKPKTFAEFKKELGNKPIRRPRPKRR